MLRACSFLLGLWLVPGVASIADEPQKPTPPATEQDPAVRADEAIARESLLQLHQPKIGDVDPARGVDEHGLAVDHRIANLCGIQDDQSAPR